MISLAIQYAFAILRLKRVTLKVFDNNPAIHTCYKACGYINENYQKDAFSYNEEKWELYYMAIKL